MADSGEHKDQLRNHELFVRADEVDTGTTIQSPTGQKPLSALIPSGESFSSERRPQPQPSSPSQSHTRTHLPPPARPTLKRDSLTAPPPPPPPPPSQPPPAPPSQVSQPDNPTDSLSLPQLKQLVGQFPKVEQRAYTYQYRDAEDFATEIDEWFHYTELDQDRDCLLVAHQVFESQWRTFCQTRLHSNELSWIEVEDQNRRSFVLQLVPDLGAKDVNTRHAAVASVLYLLSGVWSATAGFQQHDPSSPASGRERQNQIQIEWMHRNADLVADAGALPPIYVALRTVLDSPQRDCKPSPSAEDAYESAFDEAQVREMSLCLSCIYILIESSRSRLDDPEGKKVRMAVWSLQPSVPVYLTRAISRLRWDESYNIPLMHALQLLWKSILVIWGDVRHHLDQAKAVLQPRVDPFSSEASKPKLTASPVDYHLFRQEVTSKYPSYNPPLPLIPLEVEQKTILPPLPHHNPRSDPVTTYGGESAGVSIMHQPVHIATPAPSPPPSPAGPGGKGGKKQNYQTNQNFPFLYPPLDSASNNIGGKGTTQYQDTMVGRKWEGSDIPASIIEAGELFASRMRMTRAMRQLWKERDLFMTYDRGWAASRRRHGCPEPDSEEAKGGDAGDAKDDLKDPDLQGRMDAVDEYFHRALPDLQSFVIVMMKVMLTNVQDIAVRNGQLQDTQSSGAGLNRSKSSSNLNAQSASLPVPPPPPAPRDISLEDMDNIRSREVSQKALSACIFLMLKWLKVSHVLKFEYLTQLLLDSNYIQLTLKYFAHQNLEGLVAVKYDRDDLGFWHYCHVHSDHPPLSPTSPDANSSGEGSEREDNEAVPPPVARRRPSPAANSDGYAVTLTASPEEVTNNSHVHSSSSAQVVHPTVDELGHPLTDLPSSPISEYSARQFQTSISLLRVLQKVTKAKSHRVLLLVQFKSSQILRRILRVPEPTLRLYVLKLFKSQVPYCGRKWRQGNMRVITAIYLHCRPELRDEWLAGMHDNNMEAEIDEAVPLEWGLRGLTFWWQKRMYPDVMLKPRPEGQGPPVPKTASAGDGAPSVSSVGVGPGSHIDSDRDEDPAMTSEDDHESVISGIEVEDEERDFFQRELDAMGWGLAGVGLGAGGLGHGDEVGFVEEMATSTAHDGGVHSQPNMAHVNGVNGQGQHHPTNPNPSAVFNTLQNHGAGSGHTSGPGQPWDFSPSGTNAEMGNSPVTGAGGSEAWS